MAIIETDWESYFIDHHEGLGTTYERFVLHRYFERIRAAHAIQRVLEAPSFGMTGVSGINSMWWAAHGVETTILDDNARRADLIRRVWEKGGLPLLCLHVETFGALPLRDGSFDLSWNFAALGFLRNPEACLAELARVTRQVIFICVPNVRSLVGFIRPRTGRNGSGGRLEPGRIEAALHHLGWRIAERGYLDAPPWPDIAMKKEDFMKKFGMGRRYRPKTPRVKRLCILDYFNGLEPAMESDITRFAFLERAPTAIKMLWAHHRYFLFVPRSASE